MNEKKPFAQRMETFFAGKGFYIVLALCVTVIGLSAWSMLSKPGKSAPQTDASMAVSKLDNTTVPAKTPAKVTPAPAAAAPSPVPTVMPTEPSTPPTTTAPTVTIPEAPMPAQTQSYFIWPVTGEIELPYSVEALVYNPTMRDWRTHSGLDIAADLGCTVRAVTDGQVAEILEDPLLGTTVVLAHRDGLVSRYANLAALPTVSVGQQVSVGQVIGAVGDTALGEAGEVCHLHFAMSMDGESVDPSDYLP